MSLGERLMDRPTENNLGANWKWAHPFTDAVGITNKEKRQEEQAQAIVGLVGGTCAGVCGLCSVITILFITTIAALIVGLAFGFVPALITIGVGLGIMALLSALTCCCANGCFAASESI